jgi:Reverse transcriptase (RNA-dependent DNA polymerase)/Endonuclease-reverse transcriptase
LACITNDLKPDIILVAESWCNDQISNTMLTIPEYDLKPDLRCDRADTAAGVGGGLLVYAKNHVDIIPDETRYNFTQHVNFKVLVSGEEINFTLLYRPPRQNAESYHNLADFIRTTKGNRMLIGDFNLPGIDWENGRAQGAGLNDILDACDDNFLEQLVDFPTHVRGNCLDLLLTNVPEKVTEIRSVGRLGSSDHDMLLLSINVGRKQEEQPGLVRNWWKADWGAMRADLAAATWEGLDSMNADAAWAELKAKIDETVTRNVPLKPRGTGGKPPWLTRDIMREVRKKRRLWASARHGENTEAYKETEKRVRNMIRNAKRKLERKLATENGGNSKPFYAYLKTKLKNRTPVGPLKDRNGRIVNKPKEMAELLNGYFSSVFSDEEAGAVPRAEQNDVNEELQDIEITADKVRKQLKKLKPASAPGPDGIGSMVLRELADQIKDPLAAIYRKSIDSGVVPDDWKSAHVTPIYKKGSKSDPANYRPVSLTSVCCKVLEGLIRDQLMEHLVTNNLVEESQHGFIPGKSCATNLIEFLDFISETLDRGGAADVVFLDFAKAFDKVPHKRLIEKLKAVGVQGKVLAWITSWLENRQQRVVLNGEASEWEQVRSGVPQGSVLGPILFLIFIRDIDQVSKDGTCMKKFADDTKVGRRVGDASDANELQETLNRLMDWAQKWGMQFNTKKCKVMHFGRNNAEMEYMMGGQVLEKTSEERDIGVTVTKDLKPAAQCSKAARTAMTVLSQISRSFTYRDKKYFTALYQRYVRPHLEFSVPAWSPWLQKDIETLEKVQKRAVNMISGLQGSYVEKLEQIGMQSLESRRDEADMVLVYKILNGNCAVRREKWFEVENRGTGATTRAATNGTRIRTPIARTEKRRNFFSVRVCEKWNKLPAEAKNAKNVDKFKRAYRIFTAEQASEAMDQVRAS